MRQKWLVFALFGSIAAVSTSKAGTYVGQVLYPLNVPNGFSSIGLGVGDSVLPNMTVGYASPFSSASTGKDQAFFWNSSGAVNVNPTTLSGIAFTEALSGDGSQEVGVGSPGSLTIPFLEQAILWNGSAATAINLQPAGYAGSVANAVSGSQQVGIAYVSPQTNSYEGHAILWNGSASNFVDLQPSGFSASAAFGTDGVQQVGIGNNSTTGDTEALLWSGTNVATDLAPTNLGTITTSVALGVNGNQKVGYATGPATSDYEHAILWTGDASTPVDLTPTQFGMDYANALETNGITQVGYGFNAATSYGVDEALAWSGTAGSAVNLQSLLPAGMSWSRSEAVSIDSSGDIYGFAYTSANAAYAVEWAPVPEPAAGMLISILSVGVLLRRRRFC